METRGRSVKLMLPFPAKGRRVSSFVAAEGQRELTTFRCISELLHALVLCAKRHVVLVHRDLQVLDQRVERNLVDGEALTRLFHVLAGVLSPSADDHAELVDRFRL